MVIAGYQAKQKSCKVRRGVRSTLLYFIFARMVYVVGSVVRVLVLANDRHRADGIRPKRTPSLRVLLENDGLFCMLCYPGS